MKKDTFYFSHDFNARNDIKIKKLISKHGYVGYGIFWAIIEELYNNANALPTDYDCIAFDLRSDKTVIESVVKDFELFVFDGDIFGSLSVQRRLDERAATSKKARDSANKRWNNANALPTHSEGIAIAMHSLSEPNAIKESKVKEIKVKEIKVKEIKEKEIVLPEVQKLRGDCKTFFMDFYRQSKGTAYYWVAKDSSNLISLITKIDSKVREHLTDSYDISKVFEAFTIVVSNITDAWVKDNLSIATINSKFNEIFTQIKNGKQTTKSKYEQSQFRN